MTQKEFAKFVEKPQSTIGRIESNSMNVSIGFFNEIANAAHQEAQLVLIKLWNFVNMQKRKWSTVNVFG